MQLLLPVTINANQTFDSFVEPTDKEKVMIGELTRAIESNEFVGLFVVGNQGSGKTHLLTAACHYANEQNKTSILLPLEQVVSSSSELIQGLENVDLVCIDNLASICANPEWETAIFNLFNQLQQNKATVIFTADNLPKELNVVLPDLASRLQWCTLFQLPSLSEQDKTLALIQHAHFMGFELPEDVAKFMLNRLPRKMTFLMQALDTLAKLSIQKKRRLTIPFVKEVLEI